MLTNEAAEQHLSAMMDAPIIYVDTETTGLSVKDSRDYCQGISVDYPIGDLGFFNAYFPFRHQDKNLDKNYVGRLGTIFNSKPLVFHNLKFDLHSLATLGINPTGNLYDTMMIAHMVNENWPSKKLDWLASIFKCQRKEMSEELRRWIDAFGWGTVPADLMAPYAATDATVTREIFEILWRMLIAQEMKDLWPVEMEYCRLLQKIERNGIKVNRSFADYKVNIGEERMEDILAELEWNPASPLDLAKFFLDELGFPVIEHTAACKKARRKCSPGNLCSEGKASFNKNVMEEYDELLEAMANPDPTARLVLEYRGWQKAVSSLYKPSIALCSNDGRIRPNFKQHGTVTGRLSCSEPNLQQIPKLSSHIWNGDAKETFISEFDSTLLEFDFAQLEFRLGTAYGRDKVLLDAFNNGEDVFDVMAMRTFGTLDISDLYNPKGLLATAGPRFFIKQQTYSTLYGAGIERLMNSLGLTKEEATEVRERYRNDYPGLYEKTEQAKRNVETKGYIKYWTGRRRHLNKDEGHKAFNSLIQGGAAEVVKRSMLRVDQEVCTKDIKMVLTVHDSIVLEVKKGLEESIIEPVISLMTDWPQFGVKFDVDVNVWGRKDGLESLNESLSA